MLNKLRLRLRALFFKPKMEDELQAELEFHLEREIEENIIRGMTPEEARLAALRSFGGVERVKEESRDVRGIRLLEEVWQDLRYGVRMLRKNPGFTAVTALTLALGVGANTAIFTIVNAVLLRPLPYEQPGQLVRLFADNSGRRTEQNQFSPAEISDFRDQLTVFEEVGMFDIGGSSNLTGGTQPERVNTAEASPGLFTTLRAKPILGRTFLPDETEVGQSKIAVISEGLWNRRFGADPNFAGRTIQLDGESFTVVGVLPASFKFPENVDLWLPFSFTADDWKNDRTHYFVEAVGRLKPGITLDQAKANLETIVQRLRPSSPSSRKNWGVTLVPMHEQVVGKIRPTLLALFGAVGFVLLIGCVNVANLLLTRAAARQQELTIRAALGAGRMRLVRQLLTESLLLAVIGGGAGTLLAVGAIKLFSVSTISGLPRAEEVSVDGWVLLFTLIISLTTGAVFGLIPALPAANPNLNERLKEGGRHSSGAARSKMLNLLVVSEIALSLVLLVGAGLSIKSFLRLRSVDAGFDPRNLLTMQFTLPNAQYPGVERQSAFVRQALQRIETLPGVKSIAATINLPLIGAWGMGYAIEGRTSAHNQIADNASITPNYFRTMGIPLLKGRDFSDRDTTAAPKVIIINDAMARKHFPNENPLGQIIYCGEKREIVGVVGDVRPRGLEIDVKPQIYLPYAQKPTTAPFVTLTIRTEQEPLSLAEVIKKEIGNLDKDLPVADVRTMEQIVSTSLGQRRLTMLLLAVFALIAVALAAMGLYGVMAYAVSQRAHEIGVRMALGAQLGDVLKLVMRQGMALVLSGLAAGIIAAFALTRLIKGLLFEVSATDPLAFAMAAALLALVALLACYIPARRATKVDPLVALRCE